MNTPIVDIKDLIEVPSSPIFIYETDLFLALAPETPHTCITLSDTGGFEPETNYVYERPTIQVLSRSKSYITAYANLKTVYDFLHALHNETINSTRYISIFASSDILPLGRDEKGRTQLSQNYRIDRTST